MSTVILFVFVDAAIALSTGSNYFQKNVQMTMQGGTLNGISYDAVTFNYSSSNNKVYKFY